MDNTLPNTRNIGGGGYFGGYGGFSQNNLFNISTHYTGNRPILKQEQKECLNCHNMFTLPYNEPNKKLCPHCVSILSSNNNNNTKPNDPKYEPVSAREYYEQNKDRYFIDEKPKLRDSSLKTRRVNRLKLDIPICSKCKKSYDPKTNKRYYYCNDCNDYLCGNCSKKHYLQFPEHKCSQANNQNIDENDNNNDNGMDSKYCLTTNAEPNVNKNNRESREPIAFCMSCGIEKKEFPNVNFIECPTCKKTFCDSCSAKHYRLNQTHSQPLDYLNNVNPEEKKPVKEEKCIFCGVIHRLVPTRIFYDCNICKG